MSDVVVADQAFGGVERERAVADRHGLTFSAHQATTEDETVQAARGARVLFVNFAPVTPAVLESLAPQAVVIRYGIGYDNVDLAAARRLGITVCNVPDYGADTVADHTVALLLACLRQLTVYTSAIRRDGWAAPAAAGAIRGFSSTTVGLIGTGRIGRAVAARLSPFGFRILAHDPYVDHHSIRSTGIKPVTLDELLSSSDAISLHAPLTPENHHLIGRSQLAAMRRGVVLVNTSRGPLLDTEALIDALRDGKVGSAGLDVFETEPLARDSALRTLPNVILTPHAAFYSTESLANLQRLAAEEADRALSGAALRCPVNA